VFGTMMSDVMGDLDDSDHIVDKEVRSSPSKSSKPEPGRSSVIVFAFANAIAFVVGGCALWWADVLVLDP